MKRITLVLGLVAVMAAMMVALAAPAMAKDNGGHKGDGNNRLDNQLDRLDNRLDNRLDRLDNRFDLDDGALVSDVNLSPVFVTNEELADELCSPLSSDAINNAIPGCIFGDDNDDFDFVSDNDFDTVDFRNEVFDNDFDTVDFVSDIDDLDFVDVDFDRGIHFANGNGRHDGNNHNGEGGPKGHGK